MTKNFKLSGKYFCGNEISKYGQENNRLDYATFAKAFGCVLNNNIWEIGCNIGDGWELVNGSGYDEEADEYKEIFQWFIVSIPGAEMIQDYTDEILFYNEELDIYLWGVTHFGTIWDYVLMDIPCNYKFENENDIEQN